MIKRCPYCNSLYVCWNWMRAFGGNKNLYRLHNPYMKYNDLKMHTHECWDCGNCFESKYRVYNGLPYKLMKYLYNKKENKI